MIKQLKPPRNKRERHKTPKSKIMDKKASLFSYCYKNEGSLPHPRRNPPSVPHFKIMKKASKTIADQKVSYGEIVEQKFNTVSIWV